MWIISQNGDRVFAHGHDGYAEAVSWAQTCGIFRLDHEDERVVDETEASCYNCRYRRWTQESFMCLKT